jgi:branched-chain amino acid transport system permease protein
VGLFAQQLVDGVSAGAIYAALALALVLIYRTTNVVNFAQGELALLSTYVAWQLYAWGLPLATCLLGTIAVSFLAGATVERTLIRRLQRSDHLAVVTVTLGLYLIVDGLVRVVWGGGVKSFPTIFPQDLVSVGPVRLSVESIGVLAVLGAVVAVLAVVLFRTRLGLAMRAAAERPDVCALAGISSERMFLFGWGLAAALGALAGCLVAPQLFLSPEMMSGALIYAFAAAVLGGLDSPLGAIVGGITIGVVENLAGSYVGWIGPDLKVLVAFGTILAVLLVRPQGVFGTRAAVRA